MTPKEKDQIRLIRKMTDAPYSDIRRFVGEVNGDFAKAILVCMDIMKPYLYAGTPSEGYWAELRERRIRFRMEQINLGVADKATIQICIGKLGLPDRLKPV